MDISSLTPDKQVKFRKLALEELPCFADYSKMVDIPQANSSRFGYIRLPGGIACM